MRTLLFDASFSLSFAAVCSGVVPGKTSAAKAILSPCGDQIGPGDVDRQLGELAGFAAVDSGSSQTCDDPPRLETKAMVLPSGLQRGWLFVPGAVVSRFGSPPAVGIEPEAAVGLVGGPVELGDDVDHRVARRARSAGRTPT